MSENDTINAPVDLSGYKTAYGAARKTYETIRVLAEQMGHNPDIEVSFHDPEETRRVRNMHGDADCYTVSWEAGPSGWATAATGGESIYWGEFGGSMDPEIVGFLDGDGWSVESYYSFDLQFFNEGASY